MQLTGDDLGAYGTSVALLAVHSSISLNDAILVAVTGRKRSAQDHMVAANELERTCDQLRVKDKRGVQHLRWLLSQKTDVAYGTKRLDRDRIVAAKDKAEKSFSWAYNCFGEILHA